MVTISCPTCLSDKAVIRHGTNRSGTARCRCRSCSRTFTPVPESRRVTAVKEEQIVGALAERISQRGIARAFKVSRDTIRAVRKKRQLG